MHIWKRITGSWNIVKQIAIDINLVNLIFRIYFRKTILKVYCLLESKDEILDLHILNILLSIYWFQSSSYIFRIRRAFVFIFRWDTPILFLNYFFFFPLNNLSGLQYGSGVSNNKICIFFLILHQQILFKSRKTNIELKSRKIPIQNNFEK